MKTTPLLVPDINYDPLPELPPTDRSPQSLSPAGSGAGSALQVRLDTNARERLFGGQSSLSLQPQRSHASSQETPGGLSPHLSRSPSRSNSVDLRENTFKTTESLKESLNKFASATGKKTFRPRNSTVKQAETSLIRISAKEVLNRKDMLTLIDVALALEGQQLKNHADPRELQDVLSHFIGSSDDLKTDLLDISAQLEYTLPSYGFADFMKQNHSHLLDISETGEHILSKEAQQNYSRLHAEYQAQRNSHVITASHSSLVSVKEREVRKLVDSVYRDYQSQLRFPKNDLRSKRRLIECANIIYQLASTSPQSVTKKRIATVFPGGISNPEDLIPGQLYQEDGFFFIGGERASDKGYEMKITMEKCFEVDARPYFGHSTSNGEKKMQWIGLPGGQFKFDGVEDNNGKKVYLFSSPSR